MSNALFILRVLPFIILAELLNLLFLPCYLLTAIAARIIVWLDTQAYLMAIEEGRQE